MLSIRRLPRAGLLLVALLVVSTIPTNANLAVTPLSSPATAWIQQVRLVPDPATLDRTFGYSIALDGHTAVVGAMGNNPLDNATAGAVYIYTRTPPTPTAGDLWTLQARLVPGDTDPGDTYVISVALEGDTLAVGTRGWPAGAGGSQGAVHIYTRSHTTWAHQARLTHPDQHDGDGFGHAITLDGDTLMVGAPQHTVLGQVNQGAVYVFSRSTGAWAAQARLVTADGAAGNNLGYSLALDGDTALLGAANGSVSRDAGRQAVNTLAASQGKVYVFTHGPDGWTGQAILTPGIPTTDPGWEGFGWSVALAGDTALVGAPFTSIGGRANQGAAYFFTRSASVWSLEKTLTISDGLAGDCFGNAVALDRHTPIQPGAVALVAAGLADAAGVEDRGTVYAFTRTAAGWDSQTRYPLGPAGNPPGHATYGAFGLSTALSGKYALVGSPLEDTTPAFDPGKAYLFTTAMEVYFPFIEK